MTASGFIIKNGQPYYAFDNDDDGGYHLIPFFGGVHVNDYLPITGHMAGNVMSDIVTIWHNCWGGQVLVSMGQAGLETAGTVDTVIEMVHNGIVEQSLVIPAGEIRGLWSGTDPILVDNNGRLVVRVASGSGTDLSVSLLTYGFGRISEDE